MEYRIFPRFQVPTFSLRSTKSAPTWTTHFYYVIQRVSTLGLSVGARGPLTEWLVMCLNNWVLIQERSYRTGGKEDCTAWDKPGLPVVVLFYLNFSRITPNCVSVMLAGLDGFVERLDNAHLVKTIQFSWQSWGRMSQYILQNCSHLLHLAVSFFVANTGRNKPLIVQIIIVRKYVSIPEFSRVFATCFQGFQGFHLDCSTEAMTVL